MATTEKQNGQLMIESMVAISMVTIGLLGIITLLIRSSQWNRDVGMKLQATYLAAEGIEVVKNIIDTNIAGMLSRDGGLVSWNSSLNDGTYEVDYKTTKENVSEASEPLRVLGFYPESGYGYSVSAGERKESPFRRKVTVSWKAGNKVLVRAEVFWGLPEKKVVLEDVFTFWRRQGEIQ